MNVQVHEVPNMAPFVIDNIRECTKTDTVLQALIPYIIEGWPSQRNQCNEFTHAYWEHRSELAVYDGIVIKGHRIVIPTLMRKKLLSILHKQHQGIEKTRLRARQSIYWPGLNADIEQMITECDLCQTYQNNQKNLPVLPLHSNMPMQRVGIDLFEIQSQDFLICVDYYTAYVWVEKLMNTNSKTIYTRLDKIFSQFGYPENIISDNGPQLVSEEFEKYCRQYEILHTTSAPYHQAGNGRAERNIATVKQLLKKSRLTDINEILCTLRDTPIANDIPSPFTLMFGHRNIKTNLPAINNFGTLATTQYGEKIVYGESHIEKQPPKINIGQPCRFQMKPKSIWQPATVVSKTSDRNYTVETPSGIQYTRDRVNIKPEKTYQKPQQNPTNQGSAISQDTAPETATQSANNNSAKDMPPLAIHDRPKRMCKPPIKLQDYVTK
ncbi:uncharacterized protein K02A2.6-like [Anneissia japonica]|uniref:uncharacterized protein K02A2.6-like n=1 Tax=Anneissia japonica TaxID=1529436 RepID=UPI0014257DD0|nr:uncharacterized protein K02A2.6-like [Anneissia japonica]